MSGRSPQGKVGDYTYPARLTIFAEHKIDQHEIERWSPMMREQMKERVRDDLRRSVWNAIYSEDLIRLIHRVREEIMPLLSPADPARVDLINGLLVELVQKLTYKQPLIVHEGHSSTSPMNNGDKKV